MSNALIRRLNIFAALCDADRQVLERACAIVSLVKPRVDLEVEGDPPTGVHVLLSGIACRYKIVGYGRRRIVAFLLPGDLCDMHSLLMDRMDHSLATISDCEIARIPRNIVDEIVDGHPGVTKALACSSLANDAISREWLANNSGRDAPQRVGHLICELYYRLRAVGMAAADRFFLPITQTDLGDATGITNVHANRTLQLLRKERLITFDEGSVEILDMPRLETFSDFEADYLLLRRQPGGVKAIPTTRRA